MMMLLREGGVGDNAGHLADSCGWSLEGVPQGAQGGIRAAADPPKRDPPAALARFFERCEIFGLAIRGIQPPAAVRGST